jgi:hypothetical protein
MFVALVAVVNVARLKTGKSVFESCRDFYLNDISSQFLLPRLWKKILVAQNKTCLLLKISLYTDYKTLRTFKQLNNVTHK